MTSPASPPGLLVPSHLVQVCYSPPHYCYDEALILVKENQTWEEALNHCRALEALDPIKPATDYNNSLHDLVSIITEDDYVSTQKKIKDATADNVWTGLRFLAAEWLWVDGELVQRHSKLPNGRVLWHPGEEQHCTSRDERLQAENELCVLQETFAD
ncbi:hypothetical protein Q8A73_015772 [Channa argus]|nr:hypothetical protein Q8A73_015772 [Channa argus]